MGKAVERLIDISRHPARASQLRRGDKIVLSGRPVRVEKAIKGEQVKVWAKDIESEADVLVTLSADAPIQNVGAAPRT